MHAIMIATLEVKFTTLSPVQNECMKAREILENDTYLAILQLPPQENLRACLQYVGE